MTTTLDTRATAIAEVRKRYVFGPVAFSQRDEYAVWPADPHSYGLASPGKKRDFEGTRAECQAWIDREAARACLSASGIDL